MTPALDPLESRQLLSTAMMPPHVAALAHHHHGLRLHHAAGTVDIEPDADLRGLSPTLRAAVARRLAFLSAGTRELLQVAALLGTAFSLADVAAVLDRPATDLLARVNCVARERFHIDHTTIQIEEHNIPQELDESCNCHFGAWDSP